MGTLKPFYSGHGQTIYLGNAADVLPQLSATGARTIVTSPPYYGAREYGTPSQVWDADPNCLHHWLTQRYYVNGSAAGTSSAQAFSAPGPANAQRIKDGRWREDTRCDSCGAWWGQLGLEPHPLGYIRHLLRVLAATIPHLADDGTLWLNLGDSYAGGNTGSQANVGQRYRKGEQTPPPMRKDQIPGIAEKSLLLIPVRVAIAMADLDGWTPRSDVIWEKISAMPESVIDRPSKSYEHVFLFSRQPQYYYNAEAIAEPTTGNAHPRRKDLTPTPAQKQKLGGHASVAGYLDRSTRNRRDVWRIAPDKLPMESTNYAIMPMKLAGLCVLAGSEPGDTVLDPFVGAGTTLLAAKALGRRGVGIELSEETAEKAARRVERSQDSLADVDPRAANTPSIDLDDENWWEE